jgi:hypothetical protein
MLSKPRIYDGQILTVDGIDFLISIEPDQDCPPPWENSDVIGPVSMRHVRAWGQIQKAPGEIHLGQYERYQVFYDFQEAVKQARSDGWNTAPFTWKTKGEQAHHAAMAMVRYLKNYLRGNWEYAHITVHALDDSGDLLPLSDSIGGVEYDESDSSYALYEAEMLARQIIAEHSGMFAKPLPLVEDVIDDDELLVPYDPANFVHLRAA